MIINRKPPLSLRPRIKTTVLGNALGNAIVDRMQPQPVGRSAASRSGLDLDADIEAGIAGTRARNEAELLGMAAPTLDNNPRLIDPGRTLTPDQRVVQEASARRVAGAVQRIPDPPADLQTLEEVVVTAPRELNPYAENFLQTRGDYYQALMLSNWSRQQPVSQSDAQRPYQMEQAFGMLRIPQGVARAIRSVQETAHSIQQAFEHPGQALLGAGKTIANIVPETLELLARGDLEQQQSVAYLSDAMFGTSNADFLAQVHSSFELPKFSFSNPAQEGGALLFDAGSLAFGGLLAAPGRANRLSRLAPELDLRQTGAGYFSGSADEAYDAIRASTTDISSIAANTGIKPSNIGKVKNHLFNDEHLLDRYVDYGVPAEMRRFDSDLEIANAWKRLETGQFTSQDFQLLRHETAIA